MIRLVVRIDDAAMAAHVGGLTQTTYRTFDIDHSDLETLLRSSEKKPNTFLVATLVGADVIASAEMASIHPKGAELELLEALKGLYLSLVENDQDGLVEHVEPMRKALAAINNAEGRSR